MSKRIDDSMAENTGETETQRLQKQIRKMEMERIAFVDDKKSKQLKRENLIATLTQDRKNLKEILSTIQDGSHAKKCKEIETEIEKKMYQKDTFQKKLDDQKTNLWELETHIRSLEKKIEKLQTMQVTEKNYKEKITKGQRSLFKLENQLDVLSKRCDEVVNEISNLRQHIDHMLLDRSHFNDMWQKLVNKLEQGKKYIMEMIDQSTAAYDQREELCNKIQSLKDKNQSESNVHKQEMRELQRKLDHDVKLQQFFGVKGQRRANAALAFRITYKKNLQQTQLAKRIEDYLKLLDSIKLLANENDITKLANFYSKQQEENFALFNYVNELCYEVKNLCESVQQVQDDLDTQQGESDMKKESQKDTIEVLEEECEFHRKEFAEAKAIQTNINNQLNDLLFGVAKIFKFIPRSDAPILELLGSGKGITNKNVKLFLGIIKRQTNQIINCISFMDQSNRLLMKKPRTPKFNIKYT